MSDKGKKIWLVIEYDYNDQHIHGAYVSESLAKQYADEMCFSYESVEILTDLPSEVTDPIAIEQRRTERVTAELREKQQREDESAQWERRKHITIADFGNPGLCSCQTFSTDSTFINDYGYCSYCGGFEPWTFCQTRGKGKLLEYIQKLNEGDRNKMLKICDSLLMAAEETHG